MKTGNGFQRTFYAALQALSQAIAFRALTRWAGERS